MHETSVKICYTSLRSTLTRRPRQGFVFDGCIHNLAGTDTASPFHQMWQELGVLPARRMHAYDELVRVERPDGDPWTVYTNLDRLEQHTKEIAPEDSKAIEGLIRAARRCLRFDALSIAAAPPKERIKALQNGATRLARTEPRSVERAARDRLAARPLCQNRRRSAGAPVHRAFRLRPDARACLIVAAQCRIQNELSLLEGARPE